MSKTDAYEYNILAMLFYGDAIASVSATAGATDVWLSLHTADPGDAGSTANEGGYTQYTRVAVDRSSDGWAITSAAGAGAATVAPTSNVDFPQQTAGTTTTGTFTHFAINESSNSGGAAQLYNGTLSPNINFGEGVTPRITTGSSITEQ